MPYLEIAFIDVIGFVLLAGVTYYYRHDQHAERWMPLARRLLLTQLVFVGLVLILYLGNSN